MSQDDYRSFREVSSRDAEGQYEDYTIEEEMIAIGLEEEVSGFSESYENGDLI